MRSFEDAVIQRYGYVDLADDPSFIRFEALCVGMIY